MKTYVVELKYETFTYLTVQADSEEDAKAKVWDRFDSGKTGDGIWDVESVEEIVDQLKEEQ
jgi:hypothetical protein